MHLTAQYRENAAQCRRLAAGMDAAKHREPLLKMAETWEHMAEETDPEQELVLSPQG